MTRCLLILNNENKPFSMKLFDSTESMQEYVNGLDESQIKLGVEVFYSAGFVKDIAVN